MATVPTFVRVGFTDAAERTSEVRYRLATSMEDDGSNIAAVIAAVASLETALNVLTWDHISYVYLETDLVSASAAANIAANNQVYAFHRMVKSDNTLSFFELPAWDDVAYDQDANNLLSPTYVGFAQDVADLTTDPETGLTWDVAWAQSRGRKGRKKQLG